MAALLAWPVLAHAYASVHADAGEPTDTRTAAFDATFGKLSGPASLDSNTASYDTDLERLRALLPVGDLARDARFRSLYCASDKWRDAQDGLAYSDGALAVARDARDPASEARAMLCRAGYIGLIGGTQRSLPEVEKAIASQP